jgi:hypothetical protein
MNFHVDVYKIAGGKNLKFKIYNFKFGTLLLHPLRLLCQGRLVFKLQVINYKL